MTSKDALGSPSAPPPDSEPVWLPVSPSGGILERLRGFQPADDEWWHEERRNACRAYLGSLLCWKPTDRPGVVKVAGDDLNCDIHRLLLADIRECWPWDDTIALLGRLAAMSAAARFGAEYVRTELSDCLALGSDWTHLDAVAEAVHFCRRRDERAKILKHALGVAHSAEALAHDIQRLGEVR